MTRARSIAAAGASSIWAETMAGFRYLLDLPGHRILVGMSALINALLVPAFALLSLLVLEAYFDVVDPTAELPLLGGWLPYGLLTELIGALGLLGIGVLIVIRLLNRPNRARGLSRFAGSTMWQGYFVEYVIVAVLICGFLIRGLKVAGDHFAIAASGNERLTVF